MKRILLTIMLAIALAITAAACEEAATDDGGDGGGGSGGDWVEVVTLKGSTSKRSETFRLEGGEQRLTYNLKGGDMVMAAIYVEKAGWDMMEDGGFPVVTPEQTGKDSTMLSKGGGDYIIHVESANAEWTVTLDERR